VIKYIYIFKLNKSLIFMDNLDLEFEELLEKVENTDFSYQNPLVRNLIQGELKKWIQSWEDKKAGRLGGDCYGRLEDMPEKINFGGSEYTPWEILAHVVKRDEVGIKVVKQIKEYQNEFPIYYKDKFSEILKDTMKDCGKEGLEKVVMTCMCGEHNQTMRDLAEGIINIDEESIFVTSGLIESIKRLYSPKEDEPLWFLGKPEWKGVYNSKYGKK
jgi:hypothetical protein